MARPLAGLTSNVLKAFRKMRSRSNRTNDGVPTRTTDTDGGRRRPGAKSRPVVEFPEPLFNSWIEPPTFHEAFALHMRRHGDSCHHLAIAVARPGEKIERATFQTWERGTRTPRSVSSFDWLDRIEQRYRLPSGYFKALLPNPDRASTGHKLPGVAPAERRRLAWHLPDDFDRRPAAERAAILEWVRTVVISGATDYRRFQAEAMKTRYAIRFPDIGGGFVPGNDDDPEPDDAPDIDPDLVAGTIPAPRPLAAEMANLIAFKTSTLTTIGYQRNGVWNAETSAQKIEHLGLMFGALAASSCGKTAGFGVPLASLTFALLVFPNVWDWYVQWRERRRGFYTRWEVEMLRLGLSLTRSGTGWLRQNPQLANRLRPVAPLVSQQDIDDAKRDWPAACDAFYTHGLARAKEIERVARIHRDPFEPILPVLEADSPVGEYRKITEEIIRLMPDARRYPRDAAESVRSFLMLRLGLHLGLRQRNMRELLICPKDQAPRSERQLEALKRGEFRWNPRHDGWEVLIPSVAFKNASSSFFSGKPFRLLLPDLGGLYAHIAAYLRTHRAALLAGAEDPGTFFVKTMKITSRDAAYDQNTFYEAWRLTVQRYGIYNPYTERGAIKGLLPHGPHNVRDVLATHILKQTGSYEQASYAIQDTPEMVAKHYGRFLPQDKAALAAEILNRVWEAA
jgi:hypothetical protein